MFIEYLQWTRQQHRVNIFEYDFVYARIEKQYSIGDRGSCFKIS